MRAFTKIQGTIFPVLLMLTVLIVPLVLVYSSGHLNLAENRSSGTNSSLDSELQISATPQSQPIVNHKEALKTKAISKPSVVRETQNHIHYHYDINSPQNNVRSDVKTIFIGVFTTAYKYERRALLRTLYAPLLKRTPEIDLKFIVARDQYDGVNEKVRVEEREYGDIFQLHIEEVRVHSTSEYEQT